MAAPATYSILSRSVEVRKRGESTGLAAAVFTLGGGIGAAIAGYILSNTGSYDVVFYLSSGGILLTLIYVIFKIQKVKLYQSKCNGKKKAIREEIKKCSLKYKIIMLCAIAFLGDYIWRRSCFISFLWTRCIECITSYTSSIISIYLFVFELGVPIAGWVSDKIGNKRQLYLLKI